MLPFLMLLICIRLWYSIAGLVPLAFGMFLSGVVSGAMQGPDLPARACLQDLGTLAKITPAWIFWAQAVCADHHKYLRSPDEPLSDSSVIACKRQNGRTLSPFRYPLFTYSLKIVQLGEGLLVGYFGHGIHFQAKVFPESCRKCLRDGIFPQAMLLL